MDAAEGRRPTRARCRTGAQRKTLRSSVCCIPDPLGPGYGTSAMSAPPAADMKFVIWVAKPATAKEMTAAMPGPRGRTRPRPDRPRASDPRAERQTAGEPQSDLLVELLHVPYLPGKFRRVSATPPALTGTRGIQRLFAASDPPAKVRMELAVCQGDVHERSYKKRTPESASRPQPIPASSSPDHL